MQKEVINPRLLPETGSDTKEIDIGDLLQTLMRSKLKIFFYVLIAMTLCILYLVFLATERYTASTTIALDSRDESVIGFESVISGLNGDPLTINTEAQVLQARTLMGKVVDDLKLTEDEEFNPYLLPESSYSIGALLAELGVEFSSDEEEPEVTEREIRDLVIDYLTGLVTVENARFSYVFEVTVTTEDAEKSAMIVDKIAEFYILEQLDTKFQATKQATTWLSARVAELQVELEAAENAVKTFTTETDLIGPEALAALNRQIKDFRDTRTTLRENAVENDLRVKALEQARVQNNPAEMAQVADDPSLKQLLTRMQSASNVQTLRQTFQARFDRVLEQARFEVQRTEARETSLQASIVELEGQIESQSTDLLKLEQLEREAGASRVIYESFLNRLKETTVQEGLQQPDSRVLSPAVIPRRPSQPRKVRMLAISILLGLIVGSSVVLLREKRRSSIRSARDLEQATGQTVLGQIPRAPYTRRRRVLDYLISKPSSALSESVRNLRTSLLLSNLDEPPQVIVISSSVPGEGKTTLALSLSHNLAGMNAKVLLMEGDIRRHTLKEYFDAGHKQQAGLQSLVAEKAMLDDVKYTSEKANFDVIFGERMVVNAADFFSSGHFKKFLESCRREYDFIIIDTPPVLLVPDARVIAQQADAVIYAVLWDQTPIAQVQEGLESFKTINRDVTGMALTQIDPRRMKRYGYTGYAYGYGSKYYTN
ncbi:MAG: AAA family ATPase [Pseudomonadota bacterium]